MGPVSTVETFTEFVRDVEPRLHHALIPAFGLDTARESTADALAYGWEHWDRVGLMDNPAGYLYRIAYNRARRSLRRRRPPLPPVVPNSERWVEPGHAGGVGTSHRPSTVSGVADSRIGMEAGRGSPFAWSVGEHRPDARPQRACTAAEGPGR